MVHMQTDATSGVLAHVGANVRRFRTALDLSQAALADRAGISRRTIIKLEFGEANISLSGLDQLADALGVTFVDLVASPAAPRTDIGEVAWRGVGADSVAMLLASVPAAGEAQLWTWSLDVGERYDAEPDPAGWHEMLLVTEGSLTVDTEAGAHELHVGEHLAFSSAQRYAYVNPGKHRVHFVRVVVS
jgi:transcriptional regulator with XRE-family HTH domain